MSAAVAQNLLLGSTPYQYEETERGTWRRFVYPDGKRFAEYKSRRMVGTLPLVHYTYGRCPETGKRVTARGVIAVGRFAHGIIAIGQLSLGLVAIGQLSFGVVFCLAQAAFGPMAVGQAAIGLIFGVGQLATGQVAIGQFAYGGYVLAQLGWGKHVVDMRGVDVAAKDYFLSLIGK
ncbi:MAG TPA: hypothetical protein VH107_21045 [Lacipirellulaceae bacterium]|jgi:hypothetical protein|nr:hypothetical protein [Lacipirellulaceae bacterium]